MTLDFSGRRVVVTGGSRGIGRAVAAAFARAGASVSICARGRAGLDEARADLEGHGGIAHTAVCDVGDGDMLQRYIDEAAVTLGGMDVLVNNATGQSAGGTERDWRVSIDIDLMATVRATNAAEPHLSAAGRPEGGCVVNVASRSAFQPTPRTPAYGAAKAAVMHLTRSQAAALARRNIRVNCVAPGSVDFPGGWWDRCRAEKPEQYEATLKSLPFGRFGSPDDIANVVLFLASPWAGWVTGQIILADGGQTLGV
ncbi:SDR family NAD(P)-dependent oxidoreductase [Azospirillum soli]|uniref:SDR family NAD(P)-dependent oxidoreductase n=1 Tax=Azospirillum soli TaxID=1304799 RepID=UPI001AE4F094|nr:SDR family NAD(P)-dependent oxidoreductase [Azospirillum soli]MBP2316597.1 3-oxoacyl-[acyl-carrier protein] reductase [Azospirillum soli]